MIPALFFGLLGAFRCILLLIVVFVASVVGGIVAGLLAGSLWWCLGTFGGIAACGSVGCWVFLRYW